MLSALSLQPTGSQRAPARQSSQRRRFGSRQVAPVSRRAEERRGAYTVEFALCAAVFFLAVFSCFEFARFFYVTNAVDQTCYEAARVGVVTGGRSADIRQRAEELLGAYGIAFAEIDVSPDQIDESTEEITVTIRCNFADNSWMAPRFIDATDFTSTVTLDHENQAYLIPAAAAAADALNDNDEPLDQ